MFNRVILEYTRTPSHSLWRVEQPCPTDPAESHGLSLSRRALQTLDPYVPYTSPSGSRVPIPIRTVSILRGPGADLMGGVDLNGGVLFRGLHSSTFSAQLSHLLWATLAGVSLSVTETIRVKLGSPSPSGPFSCCAGPGLTSWGAWCWMAGVRNAVCMK